MTVGLHFCLQVCEIVEQGAVEHWDDVQKMAFTSVGDEWYGYGTPRSMKEKVYHRLHLNIYILSFYNGSLAKFT